MLLHQCVINCIAFLTHRVLALDESVPSLNHLILHIDTDRISSGLLTVFYFDDVSGTNAVFLLNLLRHDTLRIRCRDRSRIGRRVDTVGSSDLGTAPAERYLTLTMQVLLLIQKLLTERCEVPKRLNHDIKEAVVAPYFVLEALEICIIGVPLEFVET